MSDLVTLGDAGAPNDDPTYGGDTSSVSLDYFRGKVREFQVALSALDQSYRAGLDVLSVAPDEGIAALVDEYQQRADLMRGAAEALNAGAAIVNGMGGRMPVLSIPGTLGFPPVIWPAITIAGLATAAYVISWAKEFTAMMKARVDLQVAQLDAQTNPNDRAKLAAAQVAASAASASSSGSSLDKLLGVAKIGIVAFLAWMAFKAFKRRGGDDE